MPTLTLRRGTRRWRGVVKLNGKIVKSKWFGASEKDRRRAIIWEEEVKAELLKQARESRTPTVSLTVMTWANAYLDEAKSRFVDKTYREKKASFKRFMSFLAGDMGMDEVTPHLALRFIQNQHEDRSGYAANKDRKNLCAAWNWGRKYVPGFPAQNVFLAVEKRPEERKDRYVPSEKDFWAVYGMVTGQDQVMLLTFLHTAARRGEVFRLTWSDVDFPNSRVRLKTRKTRDGSWKETWLPMTGQLRESLRWWWENRPYKNAAHVFTMLDDSPSPNHRPGGPFVCRAKFLPQLCKRADVRPFGFHAIRHLSAVMLYHAGEPLAAIQAILRHDNATTTERYLKRLKLDPSKLQESMSVFEGRGPAKVLPFEKKKAS